MSATQLQEKLKNSTSGVIAGKLDLVAIQRLIKQINDDVVQPAYLQAQQDGVIETDRTILADVVKDGYKYIEDLETAYMAKTSESVARRDLLRIGNGIDGLDDTQGSRNVRTLAREIQDNELVKALMGSSSNSLMSLKHQPLGMLNSSIKTLVTGASDTSGGAMVPVDWQAQRYNEIGFGRKLSMLDIVTFETTDSDTVEFPRMTAATNNAAETAEGSALPESAYTWEVVTVLIQNIGHYLPVTKRVLADAGQLRSILNRLMINGVRNRLDKQLIVGNGTAPNLRGIANTVGIGTQAWSTDLLTTLLKSITTLATQTGEEVQPTAFLMNYADYEALALATDAENRFYFGGPSSLGVARVWSTPVVTNNQVGAGTAYVGDWNRFFCWQTGGIEVAVTDSDGTNFRSMIDTIRASGRFGADVESPLAFVSIDTSA